MQTLDGRVAVVTGAASGIGLAVTEAFAASGMRVFMADVDEVRLRAVEQRLRAGGADVAAERVDVSDAAAVERLGAAAVDRFGRLHVAVNNAGIVRGGRCWELPLEDWHDVVGINLWGVIHGIRAFVPRILDTGEEGHVVNTASMAAVIAPAGIGAYTATKHAILGLSDVLRAELAESGAPVGVSVVMPGMIKTGMNPIGTVSAAAVAANIVDALRRQRAYVFTDDHSTAEVEARLRSICDARDDVLSSTMAAPQHGLTDGTDQA